MSEGARRAAEMVACTIVKSIYTPHNTSKQLSFILDYCLMITVLTHKCPKDPLNIQRPFMCTSG
jgi:hypothetical protein